MATRPRSERPTRAEAARWQGAADLLACLRREPGLTRARAASLAGLTSGSAAEIAARLRQLDLVVERPAPATGRGRPTTTLHPHPDGPVVAVVDVRHAGWSLYVADVAGGLVDVATGDQPGSPRQLLDALADQLAGLRRRAGHRLRGTAMSVAGTVSRQRIVQMSTLGWRDVDLAGLAGIAPPLVVGNDASLAGLAESRRGAGRGAGTVLHLMVEVGVGGVLVLAGRPATGATGAGGEFGHLPLGEPGRQCPCGATACWDVEVDGRALARHLGDPLPVSPRQYARGVLARYGGDDAATAAVERCAAALGRGAAGLVNALDPEVVTLGGLAVDLLAVAPGSLRGAYLDGLMAFRRDGPPPLRPAELRDAAALGAAELALDGVLDHDGLARWASDRR